MVGHTVGARQPPESSDAYGAREYSFARADEQKVYAADQQESYNSQPYEERFTIQHRCAVKGNVVVETSAWGRHLYGRSQNVIAQMVDKI
jgi:hypothetical protein